MYNPQEYKEEDIVITSIRNFFKTLVELINIALKYKLFIVTNLIIGSIVIALYINFTFGRNYNTKLSFIPPSANMITDYSDDIAVSLKSIGLTNLLQTPSMILRDPNDFWVEILKSRSVYEYINNKLRIKEKNKFKYVEDAFSYLEDTTEIKTDKGLIKITIKSSKKEEGLSIAQAYLDKLALLLNEVSVARTKEQRLFLENRIEKVHSKLLETSKTVAKFNEDKKILNLETQGKAISEAINKLKLDIMGLEAELRVLKETYTDNSPKVKAVKANIDVLSQKLNQLSGTTRSSTNSSDLSIIEIPSASLDYIEKSRNIELLSTILETLTKEYEILKIREAKGDFSLKIIDQPKVSEKMYGLSKKFYTFLGILALLFFNFIFVLLIFLKKKLKDIDPEIYSELSRMKI